MKIPKAFLPLRRGFLVTLVVFVMAASGHGQTSKLTPPKRAHHELVYDPASKSILMVSGSTPNADQSMTFYNDIWRYDGKSWSHVGDAGDERSGIRMAYNSKRKKIYSFGGFTKDNNSSAQLRVLEGNSWQIITDHPEMKSAEPGFVYDSKRDRLIAFGGSPAQRQVNSTTWEWDGMEWKKFEASGPAGRQGFALAFDERSNKTILYGGMSGDGKIFDDGIWEFDGTRWENVPASGISPGQRLSPGYAYHSKLGMLILFGGISEGGIKGDTWGWNGNEWKKLSDAGPPARVMGYLAYDQHREKIVLFGGRLGWPNDTNDTWEWDGKEWKKM